MWVWRAVCSFPWHRSMICLRHHPPCSRAGTAPWAVALAAHPSLEQWWHQALQGSRVGWDSAHGSGAAAPSFPPSSDQVLLLPGWFQHRGALLPPWWHPERGGRSLNEIPSARQRGEHWWAQPERMAEPLCEGIHPAHRAPRVAVPRCWELPLGAPTSLLLK